SSVLFLAETNLTEERPSHTRTHESPGNDAEAHNLTTQTGEDSEKPPRRSRTSDWGCFVLFPLLLKGYSE
ncbi:hypothetical protein JS533_010840, partial [Bifidobacterium amazonense]